MRLKDKVAIITGGSRGIGFATAKAFLKEGAKVIITASREKTAKEAEENLKALYPEGVVEGIYPELGCFECVKSAFADIAERYGSIDILVNNAAGFGGGKTFDQMTYEEWDRLIRINLTGTYMFTNEVLPFMIKKQHGKICMVSSGAALGYDFSDPHYAASKAGMIGLAKELSQELAKHRINVNVLGTGLTDTRMAHLPGRSWEDETKGLLWYRVGTPEDQASAIVFLVSEAAEYITGQVLCPNGGAWM